MSQNAQRVAIKVNESALIRNLKMAFTNRFTVFSELLQNGRRAGASRIDVTEFDSGGEHVLVVEDDGCGISDFQKLLTVADSGWAEEVKESDAPYGMGFLSAIFGARRVVVESGGHTLDMDTGHMISLQDVEVKPVSAYTGKGTRVTMYGAPTAHREYIRQLRGFSLPIVWNGKKIDREHALEGERVFETAEIGMIHINYQGLFKGTGGFSPSTAVYLQGIEIKSSWGNRDVVIHLDPTRFFGRMPDRNCLVDADLAYKQIDRTIDQMCLDWCRSTRATMQPGEFDRNYGYVAYRKFPELLLNLEYLPACVLTRYTNISLYQDHVEYERTEADIARHELKSGDKQVFSELDSMVRPIDCYLGDTDNLLTWQWLLHCQDAFELDMKLPEGHWAIPCLIDSNRGIEFDVEVVEPGREGVATLSWESVGVQVCKAIRMGFRNIEIMLGNNALYLPCNDTIVVPYGAHDAPGLVEVVVDYRDDDEFNDRVRDEDESTIARIHNLLRSNDFAETVNRAMDNAGVEYIPGIAGKHFLLSVLNENGHNRRKVLNIEEVLEELGVEPERFYTVINKLYGKG